MADEKRRGRPPIAAESVRVSVRIPVETYDRLDRIARTRDLSVPDVIRRSISASNKTLAQRDVQT